MIDFLYHGEANVYQENLDSFLAIAEELQLEGLYGNQTKVAPEETILQTGATKPTTRVGNTLAEETVQADFKLHSMKSKSTANFINEPNQETTIALNSNSSYTEIAQLSARVKSMMIFSEKNAPGVQLGKARICKVCEKEGSMSAIADHIEFNHITGIALPCNICGKTMHSRNALKKHKLNVHKQ